jgi:glycosyltransferase involved in cell wall biosynthesis
MKEKISVCVTAGNEEANIRRCLDSAVWADEIVVVDSFSSDRTLEICREYTDRVFQHRWLGYVGQKNLIKDLAAGPWILFLDADEEITTELRDEIVALFESGASRNYAGFKFPRKVFFLGRWITHGDWYPDVKLRLLRKGLGHCVGHEPHDKTIVNGPVKRLKGDLLHYTYDNIADQLDTLNRFTTIGSKTLRDSGAKVRLTDLLLRPTLRFLRCYVLKRGFLDGWAGFMVARTIAFGVLVKYAKLREIQAESGRAGT